MALSNIIFLSVHKSSMLCILFSLGLLSNAAAAAFLLTVQVTVCLAFRIFFVTESGSAEWSWSGRTIVQQSGQRQRTEKVSTLSASQASIVIFQLAVAAPLSSFSRSRVFRSVISPSAPRKFAFGCAIRLVSAPFQVLNFWLVFESGSQLDNFQVEKSYGGDSGTVRIL